MRGSNVGQIMEVYITWFTKHEYMQNTKRRLIPILLHTAAIYCTYSTLIYYHYDVVAACVVKSHLYRKI